MSEIPPSGEVYPKLPVISVVIPTFNRATYLPQCLSSIVRQNYPALEVIVIDGGSTDDTRAVVERYGDIVTTFISESDSGQPEAVTKGLRLVSGDIAHWHAADDIIMPDAFWRIADAFQAHPDVDLVFSNGLGFNHERIWNSAMCRWTTFWTSVLFFGRFNSDSAYWRHRITVNGLPLDGRKPLMCDEDFFLRIWARHRHIWLPHPLGAFRSHGDQVSKLADRSSLVSDRADTRRRVLEEMGFSALDIAALKRHYYHRYLLREIAAPKGAGALRRLGRLASFDIGRRRLSRYFFQEWLRPLR